MRDKANAKRETWQDAAQRVYQELLESLTWEPGNDKLIKRTYNWKGNGKEKE